MNRLQKKCFVASAGVHLLLALILFIGPAFIPSRPKPEDLPTLDFVPVKTVDELISGGGNPKAKPVAALPAQPPPQPQPAAAPPPKPQPEPARPKPEPEPPKEVAPASQEDSLEPAKERQPKKIEISTKLVTRKRDDNADSKQAREETQAREQAKAVADARHRLARQIGRLADHIDSELSGGTTVELKGPGGGGLPYANWRAAIKSAYEKAWLLPDGVADEEATTAASVTIARDGTVLSHEITHLSGDSVVDRSVQATLDRVLQVQPLPETSKDERRTVVINFSVKAKRGLG